jgi:hypothetical protein
LITADADADAVHHEQECKGCETIEPRVGDHGWDGRWGGRLAVSKRYHRLPPWCAFVANLNKA